MHTFYRCVLYFELLTVLCTRLFIDFERAHREHYILHTKYKKYKSNALQIVKNEQTGKKIEKEIFEFISINETFELLDFPIHTKFINSKMCCYFYFANLKCKPSAQILFFFGCGFFPFASSICGWYFCNVLGKYLRATDTLLSLHRHRHLIQEQSFFCYSFPWPYL